MILLIANVLGYMAAGIQRCAWLRWIILLVTLLMLTLWSFKLGASLGRGEEPGASLASGWFFPVLSVFAIFLPAISLLGILRRGEERVSSFNAMLPTIGGLWAFGASYHMLSAWGRSTLALGIAGMAFAAAHFGVTQWLAMRRLEGAPGTNAFAFAGSALLGLGLLIAFETPLLTLPPLSAVALGLAVMAGAWRSGGVRLTSYLIQICVGVALALFLGRGDKASFSLGEACAAGFLALLGILHYRWCRKHGPRRESSLVFSRYDRDDYGAALCLIAALLSAFFLLSGGMYKGLALVQAVERNAFACAQTVLINLGATGLMIHAYRRGSKEIRNVAIVVTAVGAFRVFLHDLLYASGIPLVLSVFSFGLAALLESMALGRWQKRSGAAETQASPASVGRGGGAFI